MGSSQQDSGNTPNRSTEDVDALARAEGTTRAKALRERDSERHKHSESGDEGPGSASLGQEYDKQQFQSDTRGRQNGYRETQGAGYGEAQNTPEDSPEPAGAQSGYDPTHSGVRHAQNRPGTRPAVPGRETGTAWGEDQQMGTTTDTPDRKNPAE